MLWDHPVDDEGRGEVEGLYLGGVVGDQVGRCSLGAVVFEGWKK